MAHPGAFGLHVVSILVALAHDDGHAVGHLDAMVHKLLSLVGVVGDQFDGLNAHRVQHLSGEIVAASVAWKAERKVGIQGVKTGVLQRVSLHFRVQSDASPFLAHVGNGTVATLLDGLHRGVQLRPAIAPL